MNRFSQLFLCIFILTSFVVYSWSASHQEQPTSLFNGKNMEGWKVLGRNSTWKAAGNVTVGIKNKTVFAIEAGEGILVNGDTGRTANIATEYEHGDCHLSIEFVVPFGSNSGVYFQGLYEVQVLDSYGVENVQSSDCGGIYARFDGEKTYEGHPPRKNASNPPGVWQKFEVTFRAPRFDDTGKKMENARFIRVVHNGVTVHENVEVTGNTRASMNRDESPKGPLMLQGDHGPVAYRNIHITPLDLK